MIIHVMDGEFSSPPHPSRREEMVLLKLLRASTSPSARVESANLSSIKLLSVVFSSSEVSPVEFIWGSSIVEFRDPGAG